MTITAASLRTAPQRLAAPRNARHRGLRMEPHPPIAMGHLMNPIYRITYKRPWGNCVVNTAQFATEAAAIAGFAKSYKGCELVKIEDVTKEYLPNK